MTCSINYSNALRLRKELIITSLLGSAATELRNGRMLHSAAFLRQKIKDEQ